jgi:hypothetical protein
MESEQKSRFFVHIILTRCLTVLQEHAAELKQEPEKWLPWNYTAQLPQNPS